MGEIDHSDAQRSVLFIVRAHCRSQFWAGPETRVQILAERFRIPDVVIVRGGKPQGRIITPPPEAAVEVLSPDDRAIDIERKIAGFLDFGTQSVG